MSKLRMWDVQHRGCMFTLYPAAEEKNVNGDLMRILLATAEEKFSRPIPEKEEDIPLWPTTFTKEEIKKNLCGIDFSLLIENNLISKNSNDTYSLTQTSLDVFTRAKEINIKLKKDGFHCCPCGMF